MEQKVLDFEVNYKLLTGYQPFPWQKRLYECFLDGDIPNICDIPTGLGKTMVIPIWLIAFLNEPEKLPRKLVYVVDRRTIVDQSTDVILNIISRIETNEDLLPLKKRLESFSSIPSHDESFLAVSTLRGELADNKEWKFDPAKPAVIIGTVDMIGSKILFSGYGDSRRVSPLNAGVLGCDSLILNDEAHLSPAFAVLMESIASFQSKYEISEEYRASIPDLRFMLLSATHIHNDNKTRFELNEDDFSHAEIYKRITAEKKLIFNNLEKDGQLADAIKKESVKYFDTCNKVVVFVEKPDIAQKIETLLVKELNAYLTETWQSENEGKPTKTKKEQLFNEAECRISILTGQIRGYERDLLMNSSKIQPFLSEEEVENSVFFIATSAGEIGIDLHADAMISDLTTLDSMIQRLGRINRFGNVETADVDIFYVGNNLNKKDEPVSLTFKLLSSLAAKSENSTITTQSLSSLSTDDMFLNAMKQSVETMDLSDTLLDLWSSTSLKKLPARPKVEYWLHGVQTDYPHTEIVWRDEIDYLNNAEINDITGWFLKNPIKSKEKISIPSFIISKTNKDRVNTFFDKNIEDKNRDKVFILCNRNGNYQSCSFHDLIFNTGNYSLDYSTLIMPSSVRGISTQGFLYFKDSKNDRFDVSDEVFNKVIIHRRDDKWSYCTIGSNHSVSDNEWSSLKSSISFIEKNLSSKYLEKIKINNNDGEFLEDDVIDENWLVLFSSQKSSKARDSNHIYPSIESHCEKTAEIIEKLTGALTLPDLVRDALRLAALNHDKGKGFEVWQKSIGNSDLHNTLAKGPVKWRVLDGFRHELGSLILSLKNDEVMSHPESDLIMHLVTAHHGWSRPHFSHEAFPPEMSEEERFSLNLSIMERYALLQKRFGWWKLAYIESLLRRADALASGELEMEEV